MAESTEDSSQVVREMAESVAASNLKVLGDQPAFFAGLSYAQALDAAAGWRTINQAAVGKMVESIIATNPAEGGADSAAMGMLAKIMQTTPPVSATGAPPAAQ